MRLRTQEQAVRTLVMRVYRATIVLLRLRVPHLRLRPVSSPESRVEKDYPCLRKAPVVDPVRQPDPDAGLGQGPS
jgi:hypothetical protein